MTKRDLDGISRCERRAWVIGYVVVWVILAAGAARQLVKLLR